MTTSADVLDSLERAYDAQGGYIFIREITVGGTRRADAVALQLYRSRGIGLHGFEVKVSRSDWLHELAEPAKADLIVNRCLTFHVAAPQGIIDVVELPPGWGLLEVRRADGKLLRTKRAAPREAEPLDLYTTALVLRRAQATLEEPWLARIAKAVETAKSEGYEHGLAVGRRDQPDPEAHDREAHERLRASVAAFEAASGVHIDEWSGYGDGRQARQMGQAFLMLMRYPNEVRNLRGELRRLGKQLSDLAAEKPEPMLTFEAMMAKVDEPVA